MTQQPHGEKYLSNDLARPFLEANYRTFGLQNLSNSTVVLLIGITPKIATQKKKQPISILRNKSTLLNPDIEHKTVQQL